MRSITPTMKAIIFPKNAASAHPANHSRIVAMIEKTSQDIIDALVTGRTPVDLEADGCYKEPKVYQSDETLTKNRDLINKLTDVVDVYKRQIGKCPIPTPIFFAIITVLIVYLILKKTALGLYIESVGDVYKRQL